MKKTDIAMIILIATVSVVVSFFVVRNVFNNASSEQVKVKTIEAISSDVQAPDEKVFNSNAINPSVEVQIKSSNQ